MAGQTFLAQLQSWQEAIVGIVGFAGVIATLISNRRISQSQHERDVERKRYSVQSLVLAELEIWRDAHVSYLMQFLASDAELDDLGGVTFPRFQTLISDDVISNLGILDPEICSSVAIAIVRIQNLKRTAEGLADSQVAGDYFIPMKHHSELSDALDLAVLSINFAGQKLDSEWKNI